MRDPILRIAIVQSGAYEVFLLKPGAALALEPAANEPAVTMGPESVVEVSEARVIRIDGRTVGLPID